jgi:sterol desaturase/sphingolipid hydroxylase (fatty acid hydroxylase superfamily)
MITEVLLNGFDEAQTWLFDHLVQPLTLALGQGAQMDQAYEASGWLLVGLLQLALMCAVLVPIERSNPVEPITDRRAVFTDVVYTLIHRLGVFRILFFFTLEPLSWALKSWYGTLGGVSWQLDTWWPGLTDQPGVSFFIYLVVLDAFQYLVHRAQHQMRWWWQLHALHHSQRQMTIWSDARNHVLDDLIVAFLTAMFLHVMGVPPSQFIGLMALTQLIESVQHANWRTRWGGLRWVLISPQFHRYHHAMGVGHESPSRVLGGHNFGVLFPWWDMALGTACFDDVYLPTGVRDQVQGQRDYGRGFWQQQWLGLKRLFSH